MADSLPSDLECPTDEQLAKIIVIFHDESKNFSGKCTNDVLARGMTILRPQSKGAGLMALHFIEGQNGYLRLTDKEYERSKEEDPGIRKYARTCMYLEYGEN